MKTATKLIVAKMPNITFRAGMYITGSLAGTPLIMCNTFRIPKYSIFGVEEVRGNQKAFVAFHPVKYKKHYKISSEILTVVNISD